MTFYCHICDYTTDNKYSYNAHNKTKKHYQNVFNLENKNTEHKIYTCQYCNLEIKHQSSFSRHTKNCKNKQNNIHIIKEELQNIKHKIELQECKNELLELKIKFLEKQKNTPQTVNITNNIINNNISKLENLNLNFSKVLDIHNFIKNYDDPKYSLTKEEAQAVYDVCQNGDINTLISSFIYCVKKSMHKQYLDIFNINLPHENVILPYVAGDTSFRYHFEKDDNTKWNKTTSRNNVGKIITLTQKQIQTHNNQPVFLQPYQKKRIANGMIKDSVINQYIDIYKY